MSTMVVSKVPGGVISQYLIEKVAKRRLGKRKYAFFKVIVGGIPFYVPITGDVWETFGLTDADFRELGKGEIECTRHGLDGFLRQLIDSVALQ